MEWNGDDVIGMGVNGGSVYDGYAVRNTNNLKFYIKMPVTLKSSRRRPRSWTRTR